MYRASMEESDLILASNASNASNASAAHDGDLNSVAKSAKPYEK